MKPLRNPGATGLILLFLPCLAQAAMVGYWPLNGTMIDRSPPAAHNGSAPVGATWVDGRFGQALQFAGAGYADIPLSTPLSSFSGGLTVSLWLKSGSTTGDAMGCWPPSGSSGFGLQKDSWWLASSTTWQGAAGGRQTDNAWHLYAVSWDGASTLTSYRDGTLVATNTNASSLVFGSLARLTLGADNRDYKDKLTGTIDDVAVWDHGWGRGIRALYNVQAIPGMSGFDAGKMDHLYQVYQGTGMLYDGPITWFRANGLGRQAGDAWTADDIFYIQFDAAGNGVIGQVPEPISLCLLGVGVSALGGYLRRRRGPRAE